MSRAEALTKLGVREIEVSIILTVPVTAPQAVEDRLIAALSTYAADLMWVREAGIRKMHLPVDDLLFLHNEVGLAADKVLHMAPADEVWCGMTCSEAEAIADIFAAAGRTEAAAFIIEQHSQRDEPEELDYHKEMRDE